MSSASKSDDSPMVNEEDKIWNGGTTNEYNEMIRASEDYYDITDSELEFREDLVKREKMMKEQEEKNPIRSKFGTFNPREQINKMMDKPCVISHGEPRNRYRRPEGAMIGKDDDNNE